MDKVSYSSKSKSLKVGYSCDHMMIAPSIAFEALFAGVNGTNVANPYGLEYVLTPHKPYISCQTANWNSGML